MLTYASGKFEIKQDKSWEKSLKPRPSVEFFMKRTKLSELSWHGKSECIWIVQHFLSVCFRPTERLELIVCGTNVDIHK